MSSGSSNRERVALAGGAVVGCAVGVAATLLWQRYNRQKADQHKSVDELVNELKREVSYLGHHLPHAPAAATPVLINEPDSPDADATVPTPPRPEAVTLRRNTASTSSLTSDAYFDAQSDVDDTQEDGDDDMLAITKAVEQADALVGQCGWCERLRAKEGLLDVYNNQPRARNNPQVLWRLARATYQLAQLSAKTDKKVHKSGCFEAADYALAAEALLADDADVQKWCAITTGAKTDFVATKEKIQLGHKFKSHVDRALELRGHCHILHHLRARWCYGVAELSYWERKAAALLFAQPPTSSYQEALDGFLKADELKTDAAWLENKLWLGKCYLMLKQPDLARQYLQTAVDLPASDPDDVIAQQEAQQLLAKC